MKIMLLVASITIAHAAAAQTAEEFLSRINLLEGQLAAQNQPTVLANTCGTAPLPLTPAGPTATTSWRFGTTNDPVTVVAWRLPCSASESMAVLTLLPTNGTRPSFVCSVDLLLLQPGGLQTDALNFYTDPANISTYCGDVIAPVSVSLLPRSNTPTSFDFDQAFTIDFDGSTAGHQTLSMPAYNPALYNITPPAGPNSVEVRVHGSGTHFRNCQVSTQPAGGATQYSATCNAESPLRHSGFERYD